MVVELGMSTFLLKVVILRQALLEVPGLLREGTELALFSIWKA